MKVIIYHDDNDGRCAAAITLKALTKKGLAAGKMGESFTFIPATYDKATEIVNGIDETDEIYMVDFSLPQDQFEHVIARASSVTWIDHHVSAIKNLAGTVAEQLPGRRSVDRAACLLTWEYFFPDEEAPIGVNLIADRDAWVWDFGEQTAAFHYGLAMFKTGPQDSIWNTMFEQPIIAADKIMSDGRLVLKAVGQRFVDIREAVAFDTVIDGHSVRAMNIAIAGSAAFGAEGWATGSLPDDVEICCQYYHNGKVFTVSLYSKKGTVDVSEICKKRGGGGHAHAAGFTAVELPDFLKQG